MHFLIFSADKSKDGESKWTDHPKFKHFTLLMIFFVFNVALVSADIVTDIFTAIEFYQVRFNKIMLSWRLLFLF